MKRRCNNPPKRRVPFYLWADATLRGDLWIKGPRRIRLWPDLESHRYTDEYGKEKELVVVQ